MAGYDPHRRYPFGERAAALAPTLGTDVESAAPITKVGADVAAAKEIEEAAKAEAEAAAAKVTVAAPPVEDGDATVNSGSDRDSEASRI